MRSSIASRAAGTAGGILFLLTATALAAKVETWRHEGTTAFTKAQRDRVVLSDAGRLRLGQSVTALGKLEAARVWDLARTGNGTLFAATGNEGKVFRRDPGADWTVAFDSADSQVLSLVSLPDGRIFAGTGPSGSVVEVTDAKHPASRPDPGVLYVWDLAADGAGNLYAATGPTGQLWKRAPGGAWSLLLDSKHPHLLCVAVGPDGSVYAGSDGEGLIYRVAPDGKASVVYDAPQNEVRALLVAPDGSIYAGTAAEAGGSGGSGRSGSQFSTAANLPATPASDKVQVATQKPPLPADEPARSSSFGTAAPKPTAAGENVVYRISLDGVPREIFRHKALVFALAWRDDRLYVGTGPEGLLFEIRDQGRESAPVARVDHGQILALLGDPKEGLLLGAGDPGAVLRLEPGYVASGTITSEILDARLISRFGSIAWKADRPEGTSVAIQVRTGNVGEPDATWSSWSAPQDDSAVARALVPPGRFAQYRVTLATSKPEQTPELRSLAIRYQTGNLPPEIARLDVPDLAQGDGASKQARLTLRWDATDPNGDDLTYTLHFRKDGWPDWIPLGDAPLTETNLTWDTTAVPAGTYRIRLTASDRPSNSPAEALTRERVSEPFLVDHQAPVVTVTPAPGGAVATIRDDLTRIVKAAYALDGGEWLPVFPDDGLFDTLTETIPLPLPGLKAGTHVLMVRAYDAAGNVGAGDLVLTIK
jgi:hypothetical protein